MTRFGSLALLMAAFFQSGLVHADVFPILKIDHRGELHLDTDKEVFYRPWALQALSAPAHIGLFMLMPARLSSRKAIAPLERALEMRHFDYSKVISTTVLNLDDASFGASLLAERQLKTSKQKDPQIHLVIDEDGGVLETMEWPRGQVHVVLLDCSGRIAFKHSGPVSDEEASHIVDQIEQALHRLPCESSTG